jgi:uncharacterized protein YjeT (DUF2065 family)
MKVAMYIAVIALVLIVVGIAYVRLAPTDVTRWHQAVEARVSSDLPSGAIRVIAADEAALTRRRAICPGHASWRDLWRRGALPM